VPPTPAQQYAGRLLQSLGLAAEVPSAGDPLVDWAGSGAMALTGRPDGPPLVATGAAVAARGALLALQALAPEAVLPDVRQLGERAALAGLHRAGDSSCGGATRLLPTADGHVALSLARPDDLDLVPALVEADVDDPWTAVQAWVATRTGAQMRERAVLLGLPVGVLGETPAEDVPWRVTAGHPGTPVTGRPLVVDLSALWAGPLCASLLGMLGCDVVKVEDPARPDGARRGDPAFFDLLNAGARSVALDLRSASGREQLHDLLTRADVVVEGSRPRALAQLGVDAAAVAAAGTTWVSITAHGRDQGDRLGYGDDTAVAGGLVCHDDDGPVFVGDAVADPLTGLHAALAAWAGVLAGGGRLVDVALARVAATAAALTTQGHGAAVRDGQGWSVDGVAVAEPWARPAQTF
jgi:crotonobetainyl-CoA:carnitine CoA-transferase CaiB-like acyl-CoA transferase